jgi:rhodanese-related sulfurtransferase
MPRSCTPGEVSVALGEGAQVIDVREPAELATERIPGVRPAPLSSLESHLGALDRDRPVFVVGRSGKRAATAAEKLAALGHRDVRVMEGGLLAWTGEGRPVQRGKRRVWALERQVRFVAGTLVLAGVLLAVLVHPAFVAVAGFVGAGLMFAGATDICAMAMLLARMPWNQRG